jgi:hypothetical protein
MTAFRRTAAAATALLALPLAGCLQGSSDTIPDEARAAPLPMGYYKSCKGERAQDCGTAFLYLDPEKKNYVLIKGDDSPSQVEAAALGSKRFLIYSKSDFGGGLVIGEQTGPASMIVRQPDCDRIKGAMEPFLKAHPELHAEDELCQLDTLDQAKKFIAAMDAKAPGAYDPDEQITLTLDRAVK